MHASMHCTFSLLALDDSPVGILGDLSIADECQHNLCQILLAQVVMDFTCVHGALLGLVAMAVTLTGDGRC